MAMTTTDRPPLAAVASTGRVRERRAVASGLLWWSLAATTSLAVLLTHGGGAAAGARIRVLLAVVLAAHLGASNAPRVRHAITITLGVVALVIGVGFVPFVVKEPWSGTALATIVAVAAGVALIVVGMVELLRRQRRSIRAPVIALVAALLVGVVYVTSPAIMVVNAPRAVLDRVPADVGLTAVDVALSTRDGVTLAAWYVASRNRAAVVLLHGSGSTRSDVIEHAAVLAAAGFGVLMVDARGHGASTGDPMERGWHGDDDIAAATEFLTSRSDVDPARIGLVGISMGGEEAIGAAATNDDVRAVVAEGATGRTSADLSWLPARYGWRGALQHHVERWRDTVTAVLARARPPIALAAAVVLAPADPLPAHHRWRGR